MKTTTGVVSVLVSLAAFATAHGQELDPDLYSEDVPEILNQGPAGAPVQARVRFLEGTPSIDRAGTRGGATNVAVRDGEGVPEIDRLGVSEFARFETQEGD